MHLINLIYFSLFFFFFSCEEVVVPSWSTWKWWGQRWHFCCRLQGKLTWSFITNCKDGNAIVYLYYWLYIPRCFHLLNHQRTQAFNKKWVFGLSHFSPYSCPFRLEAQLSNAVSKPGMPCVQEAYVVVLMVGVGQRMIIAVMVVRASVTEEVEVMVT